MQGHPNDAWCAIIRSALVVGFSKRFSHPSFGHTFSYHFVTKQIQVSWACRLILDLWNTLPVVNYSYLKVFFLPILTTFDLKITACTAQRSGCGEQYVSKISKRLNEHRKQKTSAVWEDQSKVVVYVFSNRGVRITGSTKSLFTL